MEYSKIKIEYCGTCKSWFVRCPRCGNNSCNGGYGEDGKCPICPDIYELQKQFGRRDIDSLIDKIMAIYPQKAFIKTQDDNHCTKRHKKAYKDE